MTPFKNIACDHCESDLGGRIFSKLFTAFRTTGDKFLSWLIAKNCFSLLGMIFAKKMFFLCLPCRLPRRIPSQFSPGWSRRRSRGLRQQSWVPYTTVPWPIDPSNDCRLSQFHFDKVIHLIDLPEMKLRFVVLIDARLWAAQDRTHNFERGS